MNGSGAKLDMEGQLTAQQPRRIRSFQGRLGEEATEAIVWATRRMMASGSLSSCNSVSYGGNQGNEKAWKP